MNIFQQHIISRLKQQPKQGGGEEDKKAAEAERLKILAEEQKNAVSALTDGLKAQLDVTKLLAGENIGLATGIQKLVGVQQSYGTALVTQTAQALILEKRNHALQKSYGLNVQTAAEFGFELDMQSQKMKISRENLEKYMGGLNGLTSGFIAVTKEIRDVNTGLGTGVFEMSAFGNQMILQQRYFTDMIGVTEDAAEGLQGFAASANMKGNELIGSLSEQAKYITTITGLKGVERDIETEIGSLSAEAQQQFSRMPSTLGLAVMKMKALGLNMSQLTTTGDALLNIEESVGNELSLQLISGQRLIKDGKSITNEYRKQYLAGNAEGMAESLNDAYQTQKASLKTNMLARKEYEKLFGLESGAVAKMIQKEEIINNLRTDDKTKGELLGLDPKALETKINELKKSGALDIKADELTKLMDTVDTRKTEDKQTELLSQMYTKGIIVHQADRAAAGTMAKSVSTDVIAVTNAMTPVLDGIETFSKAFAQQLGATKQFTEGLAGFKTATSTFLAGLPLSLDTVISGIKTAQETFDKTLKKVGEINILGVNLKDFATGTAMTDMTVNTAAITVKGVVEKDDAVMMHDGVVNFNPRDKFTRVNDGMTVAGTNVGGIDRFAAQMEKRDAKFEQTMTRLISTMASQTKAALESANIKITPDRTFSSNSLNKGRYA
jgi:hypothetical protein